MGGEENDEGRLGEPHQRVFRPAEEGVETRLAFDSARQRPEMRGKKKRQQQPRDAMGEERPVSGVIARTPVGRLYHAKSADAARQPATLKAMITAATVMSSVAPRQLVVSRIIVRNPIPPWSAAASAKIA